MNIKRIVLSSLLLVTAASFCDENELEVSKKVPQQEFQDDFFAAFKKIGSLGGDISMSKEYGHYAKCQSDRLRAHIILQDELERCSEQGNCHVSEEFKKAFYKYNKCEALEYEAADKLNALDLWKQIKELEEKYQ